MLAVVHELAREGMTLVIATHEMSFAREFADRVLSSTRARRGAGPPEQVLGSPREGAHAALPRQVL